MGALGGAMNEAAKKTVEDELATKAPATMKPFFPCLGGPVGSRQASHCQAQEPLSVKTDGHGLQFAAGCGQRVSEVCCESIAFSCAANAVLAGVSRTFSVLFWPLKRP